MSNPLLSAPVNCQPPDVTLPHPRSFFEPRAYMGVLESLTQGMPPMVLIKGNCKVRRGRALSSLLALVLLSFFFYVSYAR